jgi:hypothetical protein
MYFTNDKQSKMIDELFRLFMTPDLAKDCWYIKQIYFIPSTTKISEFSKITFVLIDKKESIMSKSINIEGNIER